MVSEMNKIYLFIYCIFNGTISSSEHAARNAVIMSA